MLCNITLCGHLMCYGTVLSNLFFFILSNHLILSLVLSYQNTRYTYVTAHHCALLRLTGNTCYASCFTQVTPPNLCMPFTIYSVVLVYLYPSRILLESPLNQWLILCQYDYPFSCSFVSFVSSRS